MENARSAASRLPVPEYSVVLPAQGSKLSVRDAITEMLANSIEASERSAGGPVEREYHSGTYYIRDAGIGIDPSKLSTADRVQNGGSAVYRPGVHGLAKAAAAFVYNGISLRMVSKKATITLVKMRRLSNHLDVEFSVTSGADMRGTETIISGVKRDDIEGAESSFLELMKYSVVRGSAKMEEIDGLGRGKIYLNGRLVKSIDGLAFSYNIKTSDEREPATRLALYDTGTAHMRDIIRSYFRPNER